MSNQTYLEKIQDLDLWLTSGLITQEDYLERSRQAQDEEFASYDR